MTPLPQDLDFTLKLRACFDDIMASSHLTEGKYVRQLEEAVQKQTGLHAVAVSNCGTGLFAVYRALAQQKGTMQAIVPTNTFYATGGMAKEAGYGVVLADAGYSKFSCGLTQIQTQRRAETDVVVLTHVGGKLADEYIQIAEWCASKNLYLVEDAAHALGVPGVGLMGDAAVFSLYPTKAVPAGEGGIVVTKHEWLAEFVRVFRNYGKQIEGSTITYSGGFNLRMDEWTAAVALCQMQRLPELIERRQACADRLAKFIKPHPEFQGAWSNWYKYPVLAREADEMGLKRFTGQIYRTSDQLTKALHGSDVPMRNAWELAKDHLCLPIGECLYDGMSDDDVMHWLKGGN